MDYTARDARRAGFDGVILIVREEVQDELLAHIKSFWPPELPVHPVVQGAIAGTAQAVESARPFVDGPFGVANADDLYGDRRRSRRSAEQLRIGAEGGERDGLLSPRGHGASPTHRSLAGCSSWCSQQVTAAASAA